MHSADLRCTNPGPLVPRPSRYTERMMARALGASLDRQLAAGHLPEASPLLAARAQDIVSLRRRKALARNWDHLLRASRRTPGQRSPVVPVQTSRLAAAEPAVRELIHCLMSPLPVKAQGVAMASVLLTDATGPVYSRHSRVRLDTALTTAIAQLDPALPLMGNR